MNLQENRDNPSEIIIYKTEDGITKIETAFDGDTVWLSIDQMAGLFQRDKSTISRHIRNIFTSRELSRDSLVAKFATSAAGGKTCRVDCYNLDVIISVGYHVKSQRGTPFRIWATGPVPLGTYWLIGEEASPLTNLLRFKMISVRTLFSTSCTVALFGVQVRTVYLSLPVLAAGSALFGVLAYQVFRRHSV